MASQSHLLLGVNDKFSYKDREYSANDITYIDFFYVVTQKHYGIRKSGKDHNVNVKIGLRNRPQPLNLNSGPMIVSLQWTDLGEDTSNSLINKYHKLAKASFNNRVKNYVDHVKEHEFFWYDDKKIWKDGSVVSPKWSFNLKSGEPIYKQPFAIYKVIPGPFGLFKRKLKISTVRDSDCFSYLIKYFYGLSYN